MGLNRLLTAWLLQHYALAVWMTTGVNTRRRKPAPFDKLVPLINTVITGQVLFTYGSLFLALGGRKLPDTFLILSTALILIFLLVWVLPWLAARMQREGIPARFRKLSEGQRRWYVWSGFFLFWAAFCSVFFVAASLGPLR